MVNLSIDDKQSAVRIGYIRGQHAYEAGDSVSYIDEDELPTRWHVEGYKMGWQARLACEVAGLARSPLGLINRVPGRWYGAMGAP